MALGVVGVFVPGMPTTEFVLAASYLFARSSPRLERWLESNRWFGPSLRRFRETRGMPRQAKLIALASMWTGLSLSIYALSSVGAAAQIGAALLGSDRHRDDSLCRPHDGCTTVAHPVVAGGRGGPWSAPAPFRRSDFAHQAVHDREIGVLLERLPQSVVAQTLADGLHHGEGALERLTRIVHAPGILKTTPQGEFRFPQLHRVAKRRREIA